MNGKNLDDGDLRRVGWRRVDLVPVAVSDRTVSVWRLVPMFGFLVGMTVSTKTYKPPARVRDLARIIPRNRR